MAAQVPRIVLPRDESPDDIVLVGGDSTQRPDGNDPIFAAIRSEGVPYLERIAASGPPSNASAQSHFTVVDRGEKLYRKAYPRDSQLPLVNWPPVLENKPLAHQLMTVRCFTNSEKDKSGTGFFPRGSINRLVTETVVAKTIRLGLGMMDVELSRDEINDYAIKVCSGVPDYRKIFAILILMNRGWEIIRFVDDPSGICDAYLPLEPVSVDGLFEMRLPQQRDRPLKCLAEWGVMEHDSFARWQWSMLAPFFAKGTKGDAHFYHLAKNDILPWTDEQGDIHQGGFSSISRVRIHPCHHNFDKSNINDGTFAVKRFKTNLGSTGSSLATSKGIHSSFHPVATLKEEFEEEIEILNKFSGNKHRHLISLLAAYQRGNDCCLLFHWANCDLKKMWEEQDPGDPLEKKNLEWVLEQCQGIANGLRQIHCHQTTEYRTGRLNDGSGDRIFGRHGDIKPDNILLFCGKEKKDPSSYDRGTLVIADFGLTRFHSDHTRTYFPKRTIPATPTYRPPECDMDGCAISRSFDIWSYGCVLLEFITWYLGGWELVRKFVQKRQAPNVLLHNFNSDQFFEIVRSKGDPAGRICVRVKEEVAQFVNDLHAHPDCCNIIHELLDFIMKYMMVVESKGVYKRANCEQVDHELTQLYNRVKQYPEERLLASPWEWEKAMIPEAVEMPLSVEARDVVSSKERFSKLPEHTGHTTRLTDRDGSSSPFRRISTEPPPRR